MDTYGNWELLGHEWAVNLLQGHLTNQRVRHAYLIAGPQGVGRRTMAIRLAQALNCTNLVGPVNPCGKCRVCNLLEKMQHPDLSVVQAEQTGRALKVDQIRDLQRTLSLAPYETKFKIALLLRFEEANLNAANALLKILEEPPPHVILLLTASDPEALLPTIISRCELIKLRPLSIHQVREGLQTRWELSKDQALLLAHLSGGRPGYALYLNQNPEILDQRQNQLDDLQSLLTLTRTKRFSFAEELAKDKATLQSTLQTWLTFWRDILLEGTGSTVPLTNIDRKAEIIALSEKLDFHTTKEIIHKLEYSIFQIEKFMNARLVTEVFMMDLPHLS
jgi:DNA polymerase-3 subunit delta'